MNILKTIAWRKWIIPVCLIGLGVNGLTQVGLQKDMAAKTGVLSTQVSQAQVLSGQMTDSLSGLPVVEHNSEQMASTLQQLQAATTDMDNGLATLEHTVQGISRDIQLTSNSTAASATSIQAALASAQSLLTALQSVQQTNNAALSSLSQMEADQRAINADLHAMNQKTAMIP